MTAYVLPALYAVFLWWSTTVALIYLDGLPRRTFRWTMLGGTLLLIVALYGLAVSSVDTSLFGVYQAFTWGLLAWGWQEISFYLGYVTGPRKQPCPEGCSGLRHFVHAVQTSLYHEIAIVAAAGLVVALTWRQPNQIGTWTFLVLWWMHQSAKLNVFLGVRNINEEYLPEHLDFLKRFLSKRPMNPLFPVFVSVSTLVTGWLAQQALAASATPFHAVGYTLLATLMALAVLEHWLLVLPLPPGAIWGLGLTSRAGTLQPFAVEIAAGFLGAGKTTFLRRLLGAADPSVRTVALVNDFSELGVDAALLRGRGAAVVELPNGCICCSLKNDLADQLKKTVAQWAPQRVLIEPSGVADIAALLRVLHRPDVHPLVKALRVYTVIDAGRFLQDFTRLPDYFETQTRLAPAFIVNKIDCVSAIELQTVLDTLRALNPGAPIVTTTYGQLPREFLDGHFNLSAVPGAARDHSASDHERGHDEDRGSADAPDDHLGEGEHAHEPGEALGFESWAMPMDRPCDLHGLRIVLDAVAKGGYGAVERLKGIARSGEGWILFDVAGGRANIMAFAPHADELPRVTAIGRSLSRDRLQAAIEGVLAPGDDGVRDATVAAPTTALARHP
jgi:putative photosynthetic complex assembly protein 2